MLALLIAIFVLSNKTYPVEYIVLRLEQCNIQSHDAAAPTSYSEPLRSQGGPPDPPRASLRHRCRPGKTQHGPLSRVPDPPRAVQDQPRLRPRRQARPVRLRPRDGAAHRRAPARGRGRGRGGRRGRQPPKGGGGLDPATEVDFVVLSHVHWDHVGTPADFGAATFLVGSGTLEVLRNGAGPRYPGELFRSGELPWDRTLELPPVPGLRVNGGAGGYYETHAPRHMPMPKGSRAKLPPRSPSSEAAEGRERGASCAWKPLAGFPHTLDLYDDGSVYVVDSPGHIYGHVNLLVRASDDKYVYLGGDCCHDPRLLAGEKEFAEYLDNQGGVRSVHTDTAVARTTLDGIKRFAETGIELEGGNSRSKLSWRMMRRGRREIGVGFGLAHSEPHAHLRKTSHGSFSKLL
ncbi:uncharacterized protein PG986_001568 [Apiospora aurea]|uniref:Metallo-beta-lactamase domain-containing protein n=1 Tax=Apiospora aurea TaxID=335848 RepID=A0ABR1QY71_9PEZI